MSATRRLAALDDVLRDLADLIGPVLPAEIAVEGAVGLVLAEPLVARTAIPPGPIALRGGYAVASAEIVGAGAYAPLLLARPPALVQAGDALPPGLDAVLPTAAVLPGDPTEILDAVPPGHWARRTGEEARAGAVLVAAGRRLRALDVALALAAGLDVVRVRRPRLSIRAADPPSRDAGRLVAALARARGADVVADGDPAHLTIAIGAPADARCDDMPGIALRPGEEIVLSGSRENPTLHVPARWPDALAAALALVGPLLDHLTGALPTVVEPRPLTRKIVSAIGIAEIALLRRVAGGLEPVAVADLTLAAAAAADHWAIVPADLEGYGAGDDIRARPL